MGRRWAVMAAAVALTVGCAHPAERSAPAAPAAQSTDAAGGRDYDTGELLPAPVPDPVVDDAARAAAAQAAETSVAAFCRPDLPEADWWAGLAPLLSAQAQIDYQHVDPANTPPATVTGPGSPSHVAGFVAEVQVPTDLGVFSVALTRADAASPWLAEHVTLPAGMH